jgi:protease I
VADDGFEDSELRVPYDELTGAGCTVLVVGTEARRELVGKHGARVAVDAAPTGCDADDIDAVVIPGGWSPDRLRTNADVVGLVRAVGMAGKPVAAICHGPSLLIEAGLVRGRRVTSWPSIRTDLVNAGALWEDAEVVCDAQLITSRKPSDLPAFCDALIDALGLG